MDAKAAAKAAVDEAGGALVELSHLIHAHPELAFEEEKTSRFTADALAGGGFDVDFGVCELPTAFVARAGSGPLHVGICAEYDALPDIGHACGHNVIASAAVGAGLALAKVADEVGQPVCVLEAMKMENNVPAEKSGTVSEIRVKPGDTVGAGDVVVVIN